MLIIYCLLFEIENYLLCTIKTTKTFYQKKKKLQKYKFKYLINDIVIDCKSP